jgi:hypothetical protein
MKKITLTSILVLSVSLFSFSQEIYKRIIVQNTSQSTLTELMKIGVDLHCGAVFKENGVQIELSDDEINKLDKLGIPYVTKIENLSSFYEERAINDLPKANSDLKLEKAISKLNKGKSGTTTQKTVTNTIKDNYLQYTGSAEVDWVTPTNFNLGTMGGCLTLSQMKAELDEMRTYSVNNGLNIVSVKQDASPTSQKTWGNPANTITNNGLTYTGQGTTRWNPETIYYVRITGNESGTPENTKPQMLFTSMIHSREVSALMNNIYFMWYLIENYNTNSAIKELVDNNELYFVPVVNPDGLRWNEHLSASGGGLQRKNLRPLTGGTTNTSSNRGVDLNRNFDYFWGYNNIGSSGTTTSETYRGPSRASEPETQIMVDFILNRNFKTSVWNHSYANSVPHPYGGIPTKSSGREDEFYKWHEEMTRYNRYLYGATIFYESNGLPDDWMAGSYDDGVNPPVPDLNGSIGSGQGILGTTPEHGSSGFWPTPSLIVPIAKQSMRISLGTAYYGGKYAKLHDLTQSIITSTTASLDFGIERIGQTGSNFTVTVTPISSNINSITLPATETGMSPLEQRTVTATLQLNPSITPNQKIEYNVKLSNDNGIIYEANFEKYYQPTLLFNHIPDTDGLTGWTQSGGWINSTADAYSGSNSISTGTYSNNATKTLTTTNSYDFSNSTEVLIQFYSKWDIERNYDFVEILGSPDGGSSWISLKGNYTKPEATSATTSHDNKSSTYANFQASSQGQIYDGDRMDNWVMEEIVIDDNYLSLLNSNNVKIRFNFRTDALNVSENYTTTSDGFFIDDFKIISVQIPCDNTNPPTGITADVTTTALSAIINWDAIPSATYDLRYREIGATSWIEITDIATNTYTINSLTDATDYEIQVGTRCTLATSSFSSSVNFTATACNGGSISSYPYTESFESGIGLWSQGVNATDDDIDWTINSNTTLSTGTGPNGASNGSQYLYTESSSPNFPGKTAILVSPCINLNGYENAQMTFDYHMYGAAMGSLSVEVSTDNGLNYTSLLNISGQQQTSNAAAYITQPINLASYNNQVIKLRFFGTTGTNYTSDIAIDNINITANVVTSTTWYQDSDSDTFGNPSVSQVAVSQPVGYVADNTDCNDSDANINPNTVWYVGVDADGDGFFGSTNSVTQCTSPGAGYSTTAQTTDDCNDSDATINPNTVWYVGVDADGDGFFGSTNSVTQCTSPGAGYSTTAQTTDDCNDSDANINPNTVWYVGVDADGDGFFGSTNSVTQCTSPGAGYSTTAQTTDDCNDSDDTINPNTVWYVGVDADGDGFFGSTNSVTQCTSPGAGYSTTAQTTDDCNDSDANEFPGQIWYIGEDNDNDTFFGSVTFIIACQQPVGYSLTTPTTPDCNDNDANINPNTVWYVGVDADGDGFFGSTNSVTQCTSPGAGYSTTAQTTDDCNDSDANEFPGQIWYIGEDNDNDTFFGSVTFIIACQQPVGYSLTAPTTPDCNDNDANINPNTVWYVGVDADGDGFFGSTNSVTQCTSPGTGYSTTEQTTDDCNDSDDTINPNTVWYIGVDADGDGFFGSTNSVAQCTSPGAGYSTTAQTTDDCNDSDANINPNTVWYVGVDADGDGFFGSTNSVTQCTSPGAGYSTTAQTTDDCNDSDANINPNTVWYVGVDADGDGFFGSTNSVAQCASPGTGYSTTEQTTDDCNDSDDTINPNTVWYIGVDADGDGFFGSTNSVAQCTSPGAGYSTTAQTTDDCNDSDANINPNTVWYVGVDADGDGFFGSTNSVTQCTSPGAGYSTTEQTTDDCNDSDDTINPNTVWYIGVDADGDGFFGSNNSVTQCTSPGAGYSTTAQTTDDCNDSDANINPNTVWYVGVDADGDGFFGSTNSVTQCTSPGAGYATTAQTTDDCNDSDDTINPNTVWYVGVDADGDGFFGSTNSVTQCTSPGAGYSTTAQTTDDCNDSDANINPNTVWYVGVDADGDGFFGSTNSVAQCTSPGAGYSTTAQTTDDCNDSDDTINPNTVWYVGVDADGDGFFGSTNSVTQCTSPGAGYSTTAQTTDDCNDSDANINPGATEIVGNSIDEDCDGIAQVALDNIDFNFENVNISPNPFNNHIIITLPLSLITHKFNIIIYDLNGRTIHNKLEFINSNNKINISSGLNKLNEGTYFIKIKDLTNGSSLVKKLIKY